MPNVRHQASYVGGTAVGASAHGFVPAAIASAFALSSSETNNTVTYEHAGTVRNLRVYVTAGNRTASSPGVTLKKNGNATSLAVAFAPGGVAMSVPAAVEDNSHDVTVAAGDTLTFDVFGGGSGNANWTIASLEFDFEADDGSCITHYASIGQQSTSAASETAYRPPGGGPGEYTTTQANGEALLRLPTGQSIDVVAIEVVVSSNARTTTTTVDVNGATGSGTAPSVSYGNVETGRKRNTSTKAVVDGDKLSARHVTGTGASLAIRFELIHVTLRSTTGLSFLMAALPTGNAWATTNHRGALGGHHINNATEARAQMLLKRARRVSKASVYVSSANTGGTFTLRDDAGNTALAVTTNNGSAGWTTDTSNAVTSDATSLYNWNFTRTTTPTVHAITVAVHLWILAAGQNTETDTSQAATARKTKAAGLDSETDLAQSVTAVLTPPAGGHTVAVGLDSETDLAQAGTARKTAALGLDSETDTAQSSTSRKTKAVGLDSETDTAQADTARKTKAAGLTTEADTAQSSTSKKTAALGLTTETDTSTSSSSAKSAGVGEALEADSSLTPTASKARALGVSTELDAATVTPYARGAGVSPASEASTAGTVTARKAVLLGAPGIGRPSSDVDAADAGPDPLFVTLRDAGADFVTIDRIRGFLIPGAGTAGRAFEVGLGHLGPSAAGTVLLRCQARANYEAGAAIELTLGLYEGATLRAIAIPTSNLAAGFTVYEAEAALLSTPTDPSALSLRVTAAAAPNTAGTVDVSWLEAVWPPTTDTAHADTARKTVALGVAGEADEAVTLGAGIPVETAAELDTAPAATARKTVTLGLCTETDTSSSSTSTKTAAAGVALEADEAFAVEARQPITVAVGVALELDEATGAGVIFPIVVLLGVALELDTARKTSRVHGPRGFRFSPADLGADTAGYLMPSAPHGR